MVSDADMMQIQDDGLARLAELQLALAEKISGLAQASDDAAEVADLAKALEGCGRALRLTYALRAKLRREGRKDSREETRIAEAEHRNASRAHWEDVRSRVETLTWNEADWESEDAFTEKFDRALDLECLDEAFLELDLNAQADRVIRRLGFQVPDPPPPGEVARRDGGGPLKPPG